MSRRIMMTLTALYLRNSTIDELQLRLSIYKERDYICLKVLNSIIAAIAIKKGRRAMKVLVIYDLVPEETKRAVIEMTDKEYEYFSQAHNVIINCTETTPEQERASLTINAAFATDEEGKEYCQSNKEKEYYGKWANDFALRDISDVQHLICSGFYI